MQSLIQYWRNDSASSNFTECEGSVLHTTCISGFKHNFSQCRNGHTGLLCGTCDPSISYYTTKVRFDIMCCFYFKSFWENISIYYIFLCHYTIYTRILNYRKNYFFFPYRFYLVFINLSFHYIDHNLKNKSVVD